MNTKQAIELSLITLRDAHSFLQPNIDVIFSKNLIMGVILILEKELESLQSTEKDSSNDER